MDDALQQFYIFTKSLPDDVFADIERLREESNYLQTFICRKGSIADLFNLDLVFEFYKALGIEFPLSVRQTVQNLCAKEIKTFGDPIPPFVYFNAGTKAELVTTGLLLGYPIESTASILCGC